MNKDFLYKPIKINNYAAVNAEMLEYDRVLGDLQKFSKLDVPQVAKHLPILFEWFNNQELEVSKAFHISIKSGVAQAVHIDTISTYLAINLPVRGCDDSYTAFYKNKGTIVTEHTPHTNLPYERYIDDNLEEIGRYILNSPTILNVKIPHSVVNHGKDSRVCFSFRFKTDPWHLTA